jgi:hypothetical protein
MIANMARPFDDHSGVLSAPDPLPPFQDDPAGQARGTRAYWSTQPLPRTPPPLQQWSYGTAPTISGVGLGNQSRVGLALRSGPRWGLMVATLLLLVVGAVVALPFLPFVPAALQPIRSLVVDLGQRVGLLGGKAGEPGAMDDQSSAPRGPRIVQLPEAAPAAMPAPDPVQRASRRGGGPSAARESARLARLRLPSLRAHAEVAAAPSVSEPAPTSPFPEAEEVRAAPAPVAAAPVAAAPVAAPHPVEAAPRPAPGSIDDLMANAVKEPPARTRSGELDQRLATMDEKHETVRRPVVSEDAVHNLTPGEIQSAMKPIQRKLSDCGRQFQASGSAEMKVTVTAEGQVSAVQVGGVFANTPTAECIQRAVKTAVFPASRGLRFDYPIALR